MPAAPAEAVAPQVPASPRRPVRDRVDTSHLNEARGCHRGPAWDLRCEEVRAALRDPGAADAWFGDDRPPQLDGQIRFFLVQALLRRTVTFDEVADEAVAVAQMTNAYTVDSDWGPLLARAFAESRPQQLAAGQRRFLAALVDNDECWGSIANPMIWFRKAGLPAARADLRALLT
jgi:hypothetical protein